MLTGGMTRRWPVVLAVILLLGGGGWWFVHGFTRKVQMDLAQWIIRETQGEIVPTRVEGTIGGSLTLHDVTLKTVIGQPEPVPVATIRKATATLDWSHYRQTGKAWPKTAALEDFTLILKLDANNDLIFPEFDYDDPAAPADEAEDEPPPLHDPLEWPHLPYGERSVAITLAGGAVEYHIPSLLQDGLPPLRVADIAAEAVFHDRRLLDITAFTGTWLEGPLNATGQFWYRRDRPYAVSATIGPLPLDQVLAQFVTEPPDILEAGAVSITTLINGRSKETSITGALQADQVRVRGLPAASLHLPFAWADEALIITGASMSAFAGTVELDGVYRTHPDEAAGEQPVEAEVRIAGVDLGQYLMAVRQPDFNISAPIDGTLQISKDEGKALTIAGALAAPVLQIRGLEFREATVALDFRDGILAITEGAFRPEPGGRVRFEGSIRDAAQWAQHPARLALTLDQVPLAPVLGTQGIPTYGIEGSMSGPVTFTLRAPSDWEGRLDIRSTNGRMWDPYAEDFTARAANPAGTPGRPQLMNYSLIELRTTVRPTRVRLDALTLRSHDLELDVAGSITAPQPVDLEGTMRLRRSRARQVPRYGRFVRLLPADGAGFVRFKFTVKGPVNNAQFDPEVEANVSAGVKHQLRELRDRMF